MIAIAHQMVIENRKLWPNQIAPEGHQLLKKFPEYDLILTGDNHQTFVAEYEGRKLVNPGSMMRMRTDQENHEPCVFLWDSNANEVEKILLPVEKDVINRDHIDRQQERNGRVDAYVSHLKKRHDIMLSYEDNMEGFFQTNRVRKRVKTKILEAMER